MAWRVVAVALVLTAWAVVALALWTYRRLRHGPTPVESGDRVINDLLGGEPTLTGVFRPRSEAKLPPEAMRDLAVLVSAFAHGDSGVHKGQAERLPRFMCLAANEDRLVLVETIRDTQRVHRVIGDWNRKDVIASVGTQSPRDLDLTPYGRTPIALEATDDEAVQAIQALTT